MNAWWQRNGRRIQAAAWTGFLGVVVVLPSESLALYWCGVKWAGVAGILPSLCAIGVVAVGLLAGAGYFIAGRLLVPFDETVERTRVLSTRLGRELLPVTNPHDELGRLTTAINELLQRLQGSLPEFDRLTADVSHELRTPLTAMRTVGEVALREANPAILYDAVGSMLEEVRRINHLIDRLLLLSRSDGEKMPLRPKAGPVRKVLSEVSEALGMVAEDKQQHLVVSCTEDVVSVFDHDLLRLALINLAQNAIRYSPPNTTITLRGATEEKSVILEVTDQGPGIAPEHRQKIFERFYRVDAARSRAEGGVGLGLAIVKWSVERIGGKVELESKPGSGSTFRIRLLRVGG